MSSSEALSNEKQVETARAIFGWPGRMISASKAGYDRAHPRNVVVFNANICTRSCGKIWYGDIDVTKDVALLKRLSAALGEDVYVLREHDARFETEASPLLDRARAVVSPAEVKIQEARYG